MAEIDLDAIHWTTDGDGDLMPLLPPKPFNYPDEIDVALSVVYGYDDQYLGTFDPAAHIPSSPVIVATDLRNGAGFSLEITVDALTTNDVEVRMVGVAAWTLVAHDLAGPTIALDVDARVGSHYVRVTSYGVGAASCEIALAVASDSREASAQYRVIAIEGIGNGTHKRVSLERIERPIHPTTEAQGGS
jgi:hypothetical protein